MNNSGEIVNISPMTTRIPSSLKWLINKYQEQLRQLKDIENQLAMLPTQQLRLIESIESLKKVIELHDVPITADDIPSIRPSKKHTSLAYGVVTKLIYEYLGNIPHDADSSVSEIFSYCLKRSNWQDFNPNSIRLFRKSVRKRLQNMAYQGKLHRTRCGNHHFEARYKVIKLK